MLQLLAAAAFATTIAQPGELRGDALMSALRAGGYTIVLRHARTDYTFQEQVNPIPTERNQQRNLSSDGVRDAKIMGEVLRKYHVPIGEIISSPMYRAIETAEMAAGKPTTSMALRVFPATPEQAQLVAGAPGAGTNRLLVTHHFVIEANVPGIKPGEIGESEGVVVRPVDGGKVELVGRITLNDWESLAGVPLTPPSAAHPPAQPAPANPPVNPAASTSNTTLPNTHAGAFARRYLDAFNSKDTARMRAFIESSLVPDPSRPTDARLATYQQTVARFGRYEVTGVRSSAENQLELNVRTTAGDYILTLTLDGERAKSITLGTLVPGHP